MKVLPELTSYADRANHVATCGEEDDDDNSNNHKGMQDGGKHSVSVTCSVCGVSIDHLSPQRRIIHVNRCLDGGGEEVAKPSPQGKVEMDLVLHVPGKKKQQQDSKSGVGEAAGGDGGKSAAEVGSAASIDGQEWSCPVCWKDKSEQSAERRVAHLKACARKHKVSALQLRMSPRADNTPSRPRKRKGETLLQTTLTAKRSKSAASEAAFADKMAKARERRESRAARARLGKDPKSTFEDDLLTAMALSNSLNEDGRMDTLIRSPASHKSYITQESPHGVSVISSVLMPSSRSPRGTGPATASSLILGSTGSSTSVRNWALAAAGDAPPEAYVTPRVIAHDGGGEHASITALEALCDACSSSDDDDLDDEDEDEDEDEGGGVGLDMVTLAANAPMTLVDVTVEEEVKEVEGEEEKGGEFGHKYERLGCLEELDAAYVRDMTFLNAQIESAKAAYLAARTKFASPPPPPVLDEGLFEGGSPVRRGTSEARSSPVRESPVQGSPVRRSPVRRSPAGPFNVVGRTPQIDTPKSPFVNEPEFETYSVPELVALLKKHGVAKTSKTSMVATAKALWRASHVPRYSERMIQKARNAVRSAAVASRDELPPSPAATVASVGVGGSGGGAGPTLSSAQAVALAAPVVLSALRSFPELHNKVVRFRPISLSAIIRALREYAKKEDSVGILKLSAPRLRALVVKVLNAKCIVFQDATRKANNQKRRPKKKRAPKKKR